MYEVISFCEMVRSKDLNDIPFKKTHTMKFRNLKTGKVISTMRDFRHNIGDIVGQIPASEAGSESSILSSPAK